MKPKNQVKRRIDTKTKVRLPLFSVRRSKYCISYTKSLRYVQHKGTPNLWHVIYFTPFPPNVSLGRLRLRPVKISMQQSRNTFNRYRVIYQPQCDIHHRFAP